MVLFIVFLIWPKCAYCSLQGLESNIFVPVSLLCIAFLSCVCCSSSCCWDMTGWCRLVSTFIYNTNAFLPVFPSRNCCTSSCWWIKTGWYRLVTFFISRADTTLPVNCKVPVKDDDFPAKLLGFLLRWEWEHKVLYALTVSW